jgi:hypothetical protein
MVGDPKLNQVAYCARRARIRGQRIRTEATQAAAHIYLPTFEEIQSGKWAEVFPRTPGGGRMFFKFFNSIDLCD